MDADALFYGESRSLTTSTVVCFSGKTGPDTRRGDIGLSGAGFPDAIHVSHNTACSCPLGARSETNYNAFTFSARQRCMPDVDFNYTFFAVHSLDDASGFAGAGVYGSAFIENPFANGTSFIPHFRLHTKQVHHRERIWQIPSAGVTHGWQRPCGRDAIRGDGKSAASSMDTGLPPTATVDGVPGWATNCDTEANTASQQSVHTGPTRTIVGSRVVGCKGRHALYQTFSECRIPGRQDPYIFRLPGYVIWISGGEDLEAACMKDGPATLPLGRIQRGSTPPRLGRLIASRTGFGNRPRHPACVNECSR